MAMMLSAGASAAPAYPGVIKVKQPNGAELKVILCGDEHAHWMMTEDSVLLAQGDNGYYCYAERMDKGKLLPGKIVAHNKPMRSEAENVYAENLRSSNLQATLINTANRAALKARHRLMGNPNVPATGKFKGLVILANFKDVKFAKSHTNDEMNRMLNEKEYNNDGANGSVRDYYLNQSYGLFDPSFDVVGPVELSNDCAYYGGDSPTQDANAQLMIKEACQLAKDKGTDFSEYDNNNDGMVDMVYVIYAGYSQSNGASSNTIWPHMSYLKTFGNQITLDGVMVNCYATGGELSGTNGENLMGVGLICHEFTHTLGIPDLYDTSTSYPKLLGMGSWDVMAKGCYNNNSHTPAGYCSYEKSTLGWLTPTELSGEHKAYSLKNLGDNAEALKLANPNDANEYYLIENRSKENIWDSELPGEGMLVLKVKYDADIFDQNIVNAYDNYHVSLIPANGNNTTGTDAASIAFPGADNKHAFTVLTTPASVFDDGTELNCPITNIEYDGSVVKFDYNQKPAAPELNEESNFTADGFRVNWNKMADAKYYQLCVTDVDKGDSVVYKKILRNKFTLNKLDPSQKYSFKVRSEGELSYSEWSAPHVVQLSTTGISSVNADKAYTDEKWFSTDGMTLNNAQKGVNIVRRNGKTIKIMK